MTETQVITPECSTAAPFGVCADAGKTCVDGVCVDMATLCSPTNLNGSCANGQVCFAGGCILETAFCSASNADGICEDQDKTCFGGTCVAKDSLCSAANTNGTCAAGLTCFAGGCVPASALCSASNPTGPCTTGNVCFQGACVATASLCSSSNPTGTCETGKTCKDGVCVEPGVDPCTVHVYTTQPVVAAHTAKTGFATGSMTLNTVVANNTFAMGGVTFVAIASGGTPADPAQVPFVVGADDATTATNLVAAINANATVSALVTAAVDTTNTKKINFTAKAEGAAGNGIGMSGSSTFTFAKTAGGQAVLWGGSGTGKTVLTVDGLQFKDINGNGTVEPFEDWRLSPICRAKDLVTRMTVPQKVGLMSEGGGMGGDTADGSFGSGARDNIVNNFMRQGLFRMSGDSTGVRIAKTINNLEELAEAQPLGIPVIITTDPIHGLVQSTSAAGAVTLGNSNPHSDWPLPLGLAAANDAALTKLYGDTVRKEFVASGLRWQLGPMGDSATEPRWARVQNTFGEGMDVAKHTRACIEGFQGSPDGDLHNGIAATIKHFPSAGPDQEGMDSHSRQGDYNVYPGLNFDYHLVPFQAAFDANVACVMPCYSIQKGIYQWNPEQVPTSYSHTMITKLMKEKMGFQGMVTGDWGNQGHQYGGIAGLTNAEKAALWLHAGSDQLGSDSQTIFKDAYDQGLVTEDDINRAAGKILEMSFKLGIFENPYVDASDTSPAKTVVKSQATSMDGFNAQKRAIVMLRNNGSFLPLSGSRTQCDANADGTVKIYFAGAKPNKVNGVDFVSGGLTGSDPLSTWLGDYDYTSPQAGTAKAVVNTTTLAPDTDIAVIRITARKGAYSGLDAGVPLSFDAPFPGLGNDSGLAAAIKDRNKIIDAFRVRDGYKTSDGTAVAATNPKLKIVVVMHFDRPSIIRPFINGLKTLDEISGQAGSYPLVSDDNNVNPSIVTTTTATAHAGVDAFVVEFGAFDRAVLDFLFNKNVPPGVTKHGLARLPMEIPMNDAAVNAQYEDLPADTRNPTYTMGAGTTMP